MAHFAATDDSQTLHTMPLPAGLKPEAERFLCPPHSAAAAAAGVCHRRFAWYGGAARGSGDSVADAGKPARVARLHHPQRQVTAASSPLLSWNRAAR